MLTPEERRRTMAKALKSIAEAIKGFHKLDVGLSLGLPTEDLQRVAAGIRDELAVAGEAVRGLVGGSPEA